MVSVRGVINHQLLSLKRLLDSISPKDRINSYGNFWQDQDSGFYEKIYNHTPKIHEYFRDWYFKQNDINTVIDVGCGDGVYGRTVFEGKPFHGVDISKKAIALAISKDENKNHSYRATDFISDAYYNDAKYDLVFTLSVIDHVYDIDEFIKKCIKISKKYVWIAAYWGYYPKLKTHKMEWHLETSCYQNKLSVLQLQSLFDNAGVKYTIEPFSYEDNKKSAMASIIMIEKP